MRARAARRWFGIRPSRPPARPPRTSRVGLPAAAVAGVGPGGETVEVAGLGYGGEAVDATGLGPDAGAVEVAGLGPGGEAVEATGLGSRSLGSGGGDPVALLFLTSSCRGCQEVWDGLARREPLPGAPRLAVVTPGPELEDRARVAALAPGHLRVVMSAGAWTDYDVTRSPFAVVVREGRVAGEAPLSGWHDLRALLERQSG